MDEFVLIALLLAAIPICVIYLMFSHSGLKQKVRDLQDEVQNLNADMADLKDGASLGSTVPAVQRRPEITKTEVAVEEQPAPEPSPIEPEVELPEEVGTIEPAPQDVPPSTYVLNKGKMDDLVGWLTENWVLAVSALSLMLAGVFLVQYSIENSLLSPTQRVIGVIMLGLILIGAGEWIRRRADDEAGHAASLPSTFASAGLVSLFVGILAARHLYGLIGPNTAFMGLGLTVLIGMVLGWFYGPFLIAFSLTGATVAPFLIGGSTPEPYGLYYYFAMIAILGLGVDSLKRIAWISTLALFLAFCAAFVVYAMTGGGEHYIAFGVIMFAAAVIIPERRLLPQHDGTMVLETLFSMAAKAPNWPEFPTRLAIASMIGATMIALIVTADSDGYFYLVLSVLGGLYLACAIWLRRAPALGDLALIPAIGLLVLLVNETGFYRAVYRTFAGFTQTDVNMGPPSTILYLIAVSIAITLIAAWRSLTGPQNKVFWSAGAAIFAALAAILLEVFWNPGRIIGAQYWALHVLAIAIVMTVLAERHARVDEHRNARVAGFVLSALTMIAFALVLVLSDAALTVALAAMVAVAAALDRRFDLRLLGLFAQLGAIVTGWRLVIDPGFYWATTGPLWQVILAYVGSLALLGAGWQLLGKRGRYAPRVIVESVGFTLIGVFLSAMIFRWVDAYSTSGIISHWSAAIYAMVWLLSSTAQIYRIRAGGVLVGVRRFLALIFGSLGLLMLFAAAVPLNPLGNYDPVIGTYLLNSMFVAYVLPALLMLAVARYFDNLAHRLRLFLSGFAGALLLMYAGLSIRHFWRGPVLSVPGTTNAELYTYTVFMLLGSTALLILAYRKHSDLLRKAAIFCVGLTILKVFLIDTAGLTGLTRVFSFLALGLALAGLAWLNRLIVSAQKSTKSGEE